MVGPRSFREKFNWCSSAVHKIRKMLHNLNASSKCIAIFNIKVLCYYHDYRYVILLYQFLQSWNFSILLCKILKVNCSLCSWNITLSFIMFTYYLWVTHTFWHVFRIHLVFVYFMYFQTLFVQCCITVLLPVCCGYYAWILTIGIARAWQVRHVTHVWYLLTIIIMPDYRNHDYSFCVVFSVVYWSWPYKVWSCAIYPACFFCLYNLHVPYCSFPVTMVTTPKIGTLVMWVCTYSTVVWRFLLSQRFWFRQIFSLLSEVAQYTYYLYTWCNHDIMQMWMMFRHIYGYCI